MDNKYILVDAHLIATTLPGPRQCYKLYMIFVTFFKSMYYLMRYESTILYNVANNTLIFLLSHAQACLGMRVPKSHA